jgi:putative permease
MLNVFGRWYKRKFSDPDSMLLLLIVSSLLLAVWGGILMPVIVAAVIAYLLDWPVVQLCKLGLSRGYTTVLVLFGFISLSILTLVGLVPLVAQQSINLITEMPQIWEQGLLWLLTLPETYPNIVQHK